MGSPIRYMLSRCVGSVWQLGGWIECGRAVAQIMRGFVYSAQVEVLMDGARGG